MTYPPADDRLRHLIAQEINCHVDTWELAFFIAGAIIDDPEIRTELDRIAAAHTGGVPCGDRNCAYCFVKATQTSNEARQEPQEDPARIDRIRPEFLEHASVEAIDAQTRRARRQQTLWERRAQTMEDLRQTRITQKERGEWPAISEERP